jgi:hypothetical protein
MELVIRPTSEDTRAYRHGHSGISRASSRHSRGRGRPPGSDADPGHGSTRLLARPRDPLLPGRRLQTSGPASPSGARRCAFGGFKSRLTSDHPGKCYYWKRLRRRGFAGARNQQYRPPCTWWPRNPFSGRTSHHMVDSVLSPFISQSSRSRCWYKLSHLIAGPVSAPRTSTILSGRDYGEGQDIVADGVTHRFLLVDDEFMSIDFCRCQLHYCFGDQSSR